MSPLVTLAGAAMASALVLSTVTPADVSARVAAGHRDQGAVVSGQSLQSPQSPQSPQSSQSWRSLQAVAEAKKPKIAYPRAGKQKFRAASGRSKVAGKKGPLLRYRVVVEKDITGITANQFAAKVVTTLSDKRSWVGSGKLRLQRVPKSAAYDFTIYLVTPQTRDALCGDATRADPDRYTSCRNGDRVVLNVARWVNGVPDYGASIERYRSYMINHETGHRLGHHHQKCPGKGRRAPVMQQQTLGLHGCTANAWPRVRGKLYQGPAGAYRDDLPDA